jgi:ribosomal protein L16/L10AE
MEDQPTGSTYHCGRDITKTANETTSTFTASTATYQIKIRLCPDHQMKTQPNEKQGSKGRAPVAVAVAVAVAVVKVYS